MWAQDLVRRCDQALRSSEVESAALQYRETQRLWWRMWAVGAERR
ncbi:hypothetical protein [Streptomyces sp. NPDC058394]